MHDYVLILRGRDAGQKRTLKIVLSLLLVTILTGVLGWYLVLPQYRPALREGEVYGIDVSEHQSSLDWKKVAADDISFAYIKASEGSSYQDKRFKDHINGAKNAGLRVGAYHYFSNCSPGKSQAENFVKTVPYNPIMLPPVLDLEFSPFCQKEPAREDLLREIDDYLTVVEGATKKRVILYVGDDFDSKYRVKQHYQDYKYWQLRYILRPGDSRDYIWQIGNFFKVDGAPGKVDLNIGRINNL